MNDAANDKFRPSDLIDMEAEQAAATVIVHAANLGASDLFFLSNEKSMEISIRRLGTVERMAVVPREQGRHMLNYVKAMADMDISEHRRPADGRWINDFGEKQLDLRVNTIPTLYGQDMTMRIWDRKTGLLSVDELGLSRLDYAKVLGMVNRPSGLILVTGPTGTGKTTTLYACLQHLNDGQKKINTLEDPIEFALDGIRQSQVLPRFGIDFPELLRNVIRQAPNIIMIGEIRDEDTAATAVRAANSGHLVLATLHAPIAAGAIHSMLVLGCHPYFLSTCLVGVIAQRLVRTLCMKCRVQYDLGESPETFEAVNSLLEPGEGHAMFGPGGCEECFHCGYSGRTGIFEVMAFNQEIRNMVAESRPSKEIQDVAIRHGMIEFRRGALLKVAQGVTSTEDILRDVPAEYLGIEE
jgi:type II secretory ATPase GspE/PulE/Tfp pilus assembly ATPase PilB-like protein